MISIVWPSATEDARLETGQVHVWAAALDVDADRRSRLEEHLSVDERARAARFSVDHAARRFVVARGILRGLLGGYLGVAPGAVALSLGDHGKPELNHPANCALEFNVSHSGDLALYAFALGTPVGVDVEEVRPLSDMSALIARVFSIDERRAFETLDAADQQDAFFAAWTRKEAFVKARGSGLSGQLSSFSVSLQRGEMAKLLRLDGDETAPSRWFLSHLEPAKGFVGAVAVAARRAEVVCRRL